MRRGRDLRGVVIEERPVLTGAGCVRAVARTGLRSRGGEPSARRVRRRAAIRAGPSSSSLMRQAVISWAASSARKASAAASRAHTAASRGTRRPLSAPARITAASSGPVGRIVASAPSPATSPRPSSSANMNRPGRAARPGRAHRRRSSSATSGATSVSPPPSRPVRGEARTLRIRSWVGEGSRPAAAMRSANAVPSPRPRTWTLAREVSSMTPLPYVEAAPASSRSWEAVNLPPGTRTRARPPSAAACTWSAPGQASSRDRPEKCAMTTLRMLTPVSCKEEDCRSVIIAMAEGGSRCESGAVPPL